MMNDDPLDKLGSLIVKRVRDDVISSLDAAMKGTRPDIYGRKLYELSQSQPDATKDFVYQLIPYIVDGTISVFLQVFDTEDSVALCVEHNGALLDVKTLTDGLEGEYLGTEGWADRFSQERPDQIRQQAKKEARKNFRLPWEPGDEEQS